MGCTHAGECPLFPYLRASLRGWRDYYCDSEDRWLDCARYKVALTGRPVPISLLPNGRDAQHLREIAEADQAAAEANRAAAEASRSVAETQPQGHAPVPRTEPARPSSAGQPPPGRTEPPGRRDDAARAAEQPGRSRKQAKDGWWSRVAAWLRGPA